MSTLNAYLAFTYPLSVIYNFQNSSYLF